MGAPAGLLRAARTQPVVGLRSPGRLVAMPSVPAPIYLDHNATTGVLPEVLEAMLPWLGPEPGNPSSGHPYGQRARAAVDRARSQVAELLGCAPAEIVFTSGGTEANNLAIRGVVAAAGSSRCRIVTSVVEHPATARPCAWLASQGHDVRQVPVNAQGQIVLDALAHALEPASTLVTVMLAQNETGVLQPVASIAEHARSRGARVHTDGAQAVGKIPVRVRELGVDLLSIAGHKLYAPKGIGALYVRAGTPLEPVLLGAGHERGLRPGTENVPAIVGLGQACVAAYRDLTAEAERQRLLRDKLWSRLAAAITALRLNGHSTERLPNTLNVSFPAVSGSSVLAAAPELAASTGSACHEGGERPSDVLLAMGLDEATALGAVRLSLGRSTTVAQVDRAATALIRAFEQCRS